MTAAQLLLDLLDAGVQLWADGGELCFRAPKGAITPDRRRLLQQHKPAILALVGPRGRMAAASFAQQRLWLFDQLVPGLPVYNIAEAIRWRGPLNARALCDSFDAILERHDALRTTFAAVDGRPVQVIAAPTRTDLPAVDLATLPSTERGAEAGRLVKAEACTPFDLTAGPLLRLKLLRLSEGEHILSVTMHHIVADGWSMGILVQDLVNCYRALCAGRPCPLATPPIQYADFAHWQQQQLQGPLLESQLAYWKERLSDAPAAMELPTSRPRPPVQTFHGRTMTVRLPDELVESLRQLCRREDVTLFMALLAAFKCLLASYTGRNDVVVGSPVAGRNHAQIESLIGFFVNVLVLRTDLSGDPTFRELLGRIKETTLGAYAHQDLPAERLAEALRLHRDPGRALIPVAFVLQNVPMEAVELSGVTLTPMEPSTDTAKVDLTAFVREEHNGLTLALEYNTDLFDEGAIAGIAADYQAILSAAAKDAGAALSALPRPTTVLAPGEAAGAQEHDALAAIYDRSNLTMNQLLVWSGQKLLGDVPIYNIAGTCTLSGEIDVDHFRKAFRKLVQCSDALRTVFRECDGIPIQTVVPDVPAEVEFLDWSGGLNAGERVSEWASRRCHNAFDLSTCLFDSVLIRTAAREYVWYFCHHHLISDGWSYMLILRYMSDLYERSVRGELDAAPAFPSFHAYVAEEREYRKSPRFLKDKAYWRQKFAEPNDVLTFYGRSAEKRGTRVQRVSFDVGAERTARIQAVLSQLNTTLPLLFTVIVFVWLHRISGNPSVSIGIPFHNRRSRGLKTVIGLLMEAVLLRVRTDRDETFLSLLEKTKAEMFETIRHSAFAIGNPHSRPAYDIFLNYHSTSAEYINAGAMTGFNGAHGSVQWIHTGNDYNSLAIHIHDFESSGRLTIDFDFHCDVFDESSRRQTIDHCMQILDEFLKNPHRRLGDADLLSPAERACILKTFNDTKRAYETQCCLHDLIERQVDRTPDATAVSFEGRSLTYRELDERANQLAHHLASLGVGPESLVGICVERSLEMVIGLLGILKAGGAYVPLDPSYPADRLAYMLSDSAVPVLLTQDRLVPRLPGHAANVIRLDADWPQIARQPRTRPRSGVSPANLAYMIYTSGSTGRPKGAMNAHRGIVNRLLWMQEAYGLTGADRILQKTPFSFDVSVWEFFWPLLTGATLVVARPEGHKDSAYLVRLIREEGITTLHFVPSMLEVFLEERGAADCPSLRRVICSGEALSWELKEKFYNLQPAQQAAHSRPELHNLYGPTEAAVDVTYWPCSRPIDPHTVPIGYPIANTQIYILDRYLQPVPVGVSGELHIAGVNVGRGYWGRPELTAERFIPDPFSESPRARMYKTGDLARHLPDGAIEYLGRLDDQVKIRGFRIELGEIESRLRESPSIREAVVVAREAAGHEKQLVAYIVAQLGMRPDAAELRGFLKDRLPEYMVPAAFVELPSLPLSPNGKLDRKALPAPDDAARLASPKDRVAPRNPLERQLVEMWEDMLGVRPIGVTDNFFDLGGHSLVAVRMMGLLNQQTGREIPIASLFGSPTIETVARLLSEPDSRRPSSPLVPIQPNGSRPPFFCVHALFGSALCFIELARALGPEQPFFGLQSIGLEGDAEPLSRIEDMAAAYVEAIQARQPRGPYRLGGYSMGGAIAYEMAQQLLRRGEEVALLAFFDSFTPASAGVDGVVGLGDIELLDWFVNDKSGWLSMHDPAMATALKEMAPDEQMGYLLAELQKTGHLPPHVGVSQLGRFMKVLNANLQAFHHYVPREYAGGLTFIRSSGGADGLGDPIAEWTKLCRGPVSVHRVPGFHGTMLSHPHVQAVKAQLEQCLRCVEPSITA